MNHPLSDTPAADSRTEATNVEPAKSALPAQEIFEGLSLLLTIDEILQLHRHLRHKSEVEIRSLAEQCHRSSAALSNSQRSSRSSLMTRFSRMSLASSASTASHDLPFLQPQACNTLGGHLSVAQESDDPSHEYLSPAPDAENDPSYPLLGLMPLPNPPGKSYNEAEEPRAANQGSSRPTVGVTFPPATPALPYRDASHVPLASDICYACNTSFKNAYTLTKHQIEFCERKVEWVCPTCPHKVFGLQERLIRHHREAHAESCSHGCDKKEKSLADVCKRQLWKCSRQITAKKAWGCPCCVICFESLEEWSRHVWNHPVQNEKVQDWSFSTMIWSLLKQPYLFEHTTWTQWELCTWSTLRKDASQSLRYALERRELPADVRVHPDYSGLNGPAALARYAFNLGTTGKAYPRGCKTPGRRDPNSHPSTSPSRHIATNGTTDSPHHPRAVDPRARAPASQPLLADEATFDIPAHQSAAYSTFRDRVWAQASTRPRQTSRTTAEQSGPPSSVVDDPRYLRLLPSAGGPGYRPRDESESHHTAKATSTNLGYGMCPPVTPRIKSASSCPFGTPGSDSTGPRRSHHDPTGSHSRRSQIKKSQANLHGGFVYNSGPSVQDETAAPASTSWQDPPNLSLETTSHLPAFDQTVPPQSHPMSSRPVTPAKSEISQGSWTKLLNGSSPSLPSTRYSVSMSLCDHASDVDMSWV